MLKASLRHCRSPKVSCQSSICLLPGSGWQDQSNTREVPRGSSPPGLVTKSTPQLVWKRNRELHFGWNLHSLSLGRTVMLMPGSLSLMKGGFPAFQSSSLTRRTFLAHTLPWTRCFSSYGCSQEHQNKTFIYIKNDFMKLANIGPYQEVHGLSELLSHLQLPKDVYRVLVLLQVGVQGTKFYKILHHYIWNKKKI